ESIGASLLGARSAAAASVSAWRMPAVENEFELLNEESPERKKVLFVEPCSDGYVPVAIVYQPTPVFGGKPCTMPLSPVVPPSISFAYVGMAPAAAYFSIRSGRIPSDANSTILSAVRTPSLRAAADPAPSNIMTPTVEMPSAIAASERQRNTFMPASLDLVRKSSEPSNNRTGSSPRE